MGQMGNDPLRCSVDSLLPPGGEVVKLRMNAAGLLPHPTVDVPTQRFQLWDVR